MGAAAIVVQKDPAGHCVPTARAQHKNGCVRQTLSDAANHCTPVFARVHTDAPELYDPIGQYEPTVYVHVPAHEELVYETERP